MTENDEETMEKISRKKKKRGKRKIKANSTIDKETDKALNHVKLEKSQAVENETDIDFDIINRAISDNEETVQETLQENLKSGKLGKKTKSKNNEKYEGIMEEDEEMVKIYNIKKIKEGEQAEIELVKKKKRKKIKEADDDIGKLKKSDVDGSKPVKKKKKIKQEDREMIETDDVEYSKED